MLASSLMDISITIYCCCYTSLPAQTLPSIWTRILLLLRGLLGQGKPVKKLSCIVGSNEGPFMSLNFSYIYRSLGFLVYFNLWD
jgi:hypothetical protein